MEKMSLARECGLRCRRIRMAKNLSQQDLADLLFTTPQNISKYEKDGIANIDTIKRISDALGQDLLTDETDVEGTVGEVGKEILHTLIRNGGHIEVEELIKNQMYGMSMDRVTHEIFKLERIGMCVREQYLNWIDDTKDTLFITAKGVITFKNAAASRAWKAELQDNLEAVITYEHLTDEFGSYQDYIESRPGERLIRSVKYPFHGKVNQEECLMMDSSYRANYIEYLKRNHETGIDAAKDIRGGRIITGVSCYHDILYRMALKVTNDILWKHVLSGDDYYYLEDEYNSLMEELGYSDPDLVVTRTVGSFKEEFPDIEAESYLEIKKDEPLTVTVDKTQNLISNSEAVDDFTKKKARLEELEEYMNTSYTYELELNIDREYMNNKPEGASPYPTDWFSDDEIRAFINENFGPAVTDQERELDGLLKEINDLMPQTLNYYVFPKEWEENGLADLIRKNAGIEKESI